MVTLTQVQKALGGVRDPELGRDIVELGMVRDLKVADGSVSFTMALTALACPLKERLVNEARQAILALDERLRVTIDLAEMTEEERKKAGSSLEREAQDEQGQSTASYLNGIDKVIAVMSGKGGVGKSSVAAMLAVTLRRRGNRVGVLDADITGPSIPRMFDIQTKPSASPLGIIPAESSTGIKIVSINLLLPHEDDAVVWRGPLISGAIKQFWNDVFWGDLDYLVLDLPPGTSDASLTVMQSIPLSGIVLVTSPQGLAGMVVRKSAQMAEKLNAPILGLVENMAYAECPRCGEAIEVFGPSQSQRTAELLGVSLLGRLPLDPNLAQRCDTGQIEKYTGMPFEPIVDAVLERLPAVKCKPVFSE